jgi:hypothetical protein
LDINDEGAGDDRPPKELDLPPGTRDDLSKNEGKIKNVFFLSLK